MQDSEAIRNAVLRYGVSHPVINDRNMVLWRDLGVASWPTLMVVSPKGKVIATLAGAALLHIAGLLYSGCAIPCSHHTSFLMHAVHNYAVSCVWVADSSGNNAP